MLLRDMNLILLGPPGAGKGTQAAAIVAWCHVPHVSTGNIIRDAIAHNTPCGRQFKIDIDSGRLVSDELVNALVGDRLACADCDGGFLLDGYPRTTGQAWALDRLLKRRDRTLDHVLLLDVADAILIARITGRRTDPETGRIYHLRFDPPPPEIADRLRQRTDDTEQVLTRRLAEYHQKTDALVPYYDQLGLLRRVDGAGGVDEVWQGTLAMLRQPAVCTRAVDQPVGAGS
jgi:adenylate kinase